MGYTHIAAPHAAAIEIFYEENFNDYLNYHRPCGVPERVIDVKGKERRIYPWYATPWEILRQLPDLARELKEGITIEMLDRRARAKTDMEAAQQMQKANLSKSYLPVLSRGGVLEGKSAKSKKQ